MAAGGVVEEAKREIVSPLHCAKELVEQRQLVGKARPTLHMFFVVTCPTS